MDSKATEPQSSATDSESLCLPTNWQQQFWLFTIPLTTMYHLRQQKVKLAILQA